MTDDDVPCTCRHLNSAHRGRKHTGRCTGRDSYDCPCACTLYERDPEWDEMFGGDSWQIKLKNPVGPALRTLRERSGKTVLDVALKIEVSPQAVYQWENGTNGISVVSLLAYCEAIGTELHVIVGGGQ